MKKAIIAFLWFLFWVFLAMPATACGGCVVAGVEMAVLLGTAFPVMWTMGTFGIIAIGNEVEDTPPSPRRVHPWLLWVLLVALTAAAMFFGGRPG